MISAAVRAKALRYLGEGRLEVRSVACGRVEASCRGSGGTLYTLGHDAAAGWQCDCPAFGDCCHLHALRLVSPKTLVPAGGASIEGGEL